MSSIATTRVPMGNTFCVGAVSPVCCFILNESFDVLTNQPIITIHFFCLHSEIIKRVTECEMPPFRPTVTPLIPRVEELRELMKCLLG